MNTKLTIEEPYELVGKGIKQTKDVWFACDIEGMWAFDSEPILRRGDLWYPSEGGKISGPKVWWMPNINLQPGECKKVKLIFEVIEDEK